MPRPRTRCRPAPRDLGRCLVAVLVASLLGLAVLACGSKSPFATAVDDPFAGGYPTFRDAATGYRLVFGTPDLGVGTQRIAFALLSDEGVVSMPVLSATTHRVAGGSMGDAVEREDMGYQPFPFGSRGIYVGEFRFDRPGRWALAITVPREGGEAATITFPFDVAESPLAPAVGAPAPRSANRTLADVASVAALSTGEAPDPRLYEHRIADEVDAGHPFVVVFASPAFCTNALCGPQVEMLSELADTFGDRIDFIHVDLYENPQEIQGDLGRARRTPVLAEWGVRTDEWTFVVGADGRVGARFEGFVPRPELEAAIIRTLEGPGR